jgi:hypothetical protein
MVFLVLSSGIILGKKKPIETKETKETKKKGSRPE